MIGRKRCKGLKLMGNGFPYEPFVQWLRRQLVSHAVWERLVPLLRRRA
jgi:hypothetical protein